MAKEWHSIGYLLDWRRVGDTMNVDVRVKIKPRLGS